MKLAVDKRCARRIIESDSSNSERDSVSDFDDYDGDASSWSIADCSSNDDVTLTGDAAKKTH